MGFLLFLVGVVLLIVLSVWNRKDDQSELESFLASRNISHPAEVDYWVRQFEKKSQSLF